VVDALNTRVEGVNKLPELMPLARVAGFDKNLAIVIVHPGDIDAKGSMASRL
jgi:hypothetical protein